jgi:hypothetical protein
MVSKVPTAQNKAKRFLLTSVQQSVILEYDNENEVETLLPVAYNQATLKNSGLCTLNAVIRSKKMVEAKKLGLVGR